MDAGGHAEVTIAAIRPSPALFYSQWTAAARLETADPLDPQDVFIPSEPDSDPEMYVAQSPDPAVSEARFEEISAREGWRANNGADFDDAMRLISQKRPEVFNDLTGSGYAVGVDHNEHAAAAGRASIPRRPGDRVHIQVQTQDAKGARSALSIGKDIIHEHTHARLYKDFGVTLDEVERNGKRTALGLLLSPIDESLAYHKGNDFYLENGGKAADISELLDIQSKKDGLVAIIRGVQGAHQKSHGKYARPSDDDYGAAARYGFSREKVDEEWRYAWEAYDSLSSQQKARVGEFLNYRDSHLNPEAGTRANV